MRYLLLITSVFIFSGGCTDEGANSGLKDISAYDKLRYEKATIFSALDENNTGHVFFKQCVISSNANRNCTAVGQSKSLPNGVTYQKKMPIRSYEQKLPEDKREKILSALPEGEDVTLTYPGGGVEGGDLSEEDVRISFSPFGWPVGSGPGGGNDGGNDGGGPTVAMRFIAFPEQGFEMQETEVTRGQWKSVMGAYPEDRPGWEKCLFEETIVYEDNYPVSCITWDETQQFASEKTRKDDKYYYKLPNKKEWKHAAGYIAGTVFGHCNKHKLQPVGKLKAHNGLYDMLGNVGDMVDEHGRTGSSNGADIIYSRGGSIIFDAEDCNFGKKSWIFLEKRVSTVGFRLLRFPRR